MSITTPEPTAFDHLEHLVARLPLTQKSVEDEMRRIAQGSSSLESLKLELTGTVMTLMAEQQQAIRTLAEELYRHRQWAAEEQQDVGEHLSELEDRMAAIEGEDSQLTAEDAEKFARLVAWAELSAKQALEHTTDPTGREKLSEVIALAAWANERIIEVTLIDADEGDEGDEDEGEGDEEAEELADSGVSP